MSDELLKDALMIIDLQNGVCCGEKPLYQLEKLIVKVNQKISKYHEAGLPIIFVQHNEEDLVANTSAWEIIPKLQKDKGTLFLQKWHANAFYQTNLADELQKRKIQNIEICGAQTEYCLDATIKMAHGLGYQLFMERNLTSTVDNPYMSAKDTICFYEGIWDKRFLTLY